MSTTKKWPILSSKFNFPFSNDKLNVFHEISLSPLIQPVSKVLPYRGRIDYSHRF